MKLNHTRRTAAVFAVLLGGLVSIAAVGPLAGVASAATSSTISYNWLTGGVSGSGFTPSGKVFVQVMEGTTVLGSATAWASRPRIFCIPARPGEPRDCEETSPGGQFGATLPTLALGCAGTATGTVSATDLTTGSVVSEPVTWYGMC